VNKKSKTKHNTLPTSTSCQDRLIGNRFTLPHETHILKRQKIWKNNHFKPIKNHATKENNPWEIGKKRGESYNCPRWW
jgi:hypothetical protein